jgi:hypothetical protein
MTLCKYYEFWSSENSHYQNCCLLVCDAELSGRTVPRFLWNIGTSSTGLHGITYQNTALIIQINFNISQNTAIKIIMMVINTPLKICPILIQVSCYLFAEVVRGDLCPAMIVDGCCIKCWSWLVYGVTVEVVVYRVVGVGLRLEVLFHCFTRKWA